jgi:diguanylate cyclase (GGDEF)-like protein/PAS domain S-box-containing protein
MCAAMFRSFYKYLAQWLFVSAVLGIVPFLYFVKEFDKAHEQTVQMIEQKSHSQLEYNKHELLAAFHDVHNVTQVLSNNRMLHDALQLPSATNIKTVQEFWLLATQMQTLYSRLRLFDTTGNELIRVDQHNGSTTAIPTTQLKNKLHRDYFQYAQSLAFNQIGIFGVDREKEIDDNPSVLLAVFRIIAPIDFDGKRQGYFVATLNLAQLYNKFNQSLNSLSHPEIISFKGQYIHHENEMLSQQENHSKYHMLNINSVAPLLWKSMQGQASGTVWDNNRWYSFTQVPLQSIFPEMEPIYLVQSLNDDALNKLLSATELRIGFQAVGIALLVMTIAAGFIRWNANHDKNSIESKLARAAMNGMSAMVITDRNNRIIKVNNEFTRISGYTLAEVRGKQPSVFSSGKHNQAFYMNMWKVLQDEGLWEGEVINKRKDGSMQTEILRIQTIRDSNGIIQFYVASFVDISHRKELENRLRELSEKDALTNIWNRRKFDQEMRSECLRVKRYQTQVQSCLAIIDIDHFKRINDKLGHAEGDKIIRSVAKQLGEYLRATDFLARIGGEEFAIIMPHTPLAEAELVMHRLRVAVHLNHRLEVSISGGITDITEKPEEVYKRADIALYESKASGRNLVSVLTSAEMEEFA